MHINLLIMRSYLKIAARYDMKKIMYYNMPFAKELKESFDEAEKLYTEAKDYWEKVKEYARSAGEIKRTTGLSYMESERYSIVKGELDFGKIINGYIKKLNDKRGILESAKAP